MATCTLGLVTLVLLAAGCADDSATTTAPSATAPGVTAPPASTQSAPSVTESTLAVTPPATQDVGDPTPSQTEGPYYLSGSPERTSLVEAGSTGERLVVQGRVMDAAGRPLPGLTMEFWQADETGAYDLEGYRYRGHQLTGADGAYRLETVVPGLYSGRTRHIHVKVVDPERGDLTTQLYLPGEPQNERDGIFDARLLLRDVTVVDGVRTGTFDFVLGG